MTIKDELHRLIDELDEDVACEAFARLQDLRPVRVLGKAAPIGDKPETDEERKTVAETAAAMAPGDVIHDKDLDRELRNELRKG